MNNGLQSHMVEEPTSVRNSSDAQFFSVPKNWEGLYIELLAITPQLLLYNMAAGG